MPGTRARLTSTSRRVRRAVLARRRLLAALLTAVAVAAGVRAVAPPPPDRVPVLVAAHDLSPGTVLGGDDLRAAGFAPGTVPRGALPGSATSAVVGRTLAAPMTAGEPVLPVRLVGPDLAAAYSPRVALPVRLPDAGIAALLRVGDRVDLLATDAQAGPAATDGSAGATVVASGVPVLALPATDASDATSALGAGGPTGRLVVVGVLPDEVPRVADAAVRAFLSIVWSR
jgi:Flp pilus assembly protein CpaB